MPDLTLFEEDRAYVIEKLHNGHFDYTQRFPLGGKHGWTAGRLRAVVGNPAR